MIFRYGRFSRLRFAGLGSNIVSDSMEMLKLYFFFVVLRFIIFVNILIVRYLNDKSVILNLKVERYNY